MIPKIFAIIVLLIQESFIFPINLCKKDKSVSKQKNDYIFMFYVNFKLFSIFSCDDFKSRASIEAITTDWFPHVKASSKRAEITRIIRAKAPAGPKVEVGEKKRVELSRDSVTSSKRPPSQPPDIVLPEQKRGRMEDEKTVKLIDIVSKLKYAELQKELGLRGLAKSGKKEVLAARFLSCLEMEVKGTILPPRKRKCESLSISNKHFKSDKDYIRR